MADIIEDMGYETLDAELFGEAKKPNPLVGHTLDLGLGVEVVIVEVHDVNNLVITDTSNLPPGKYKLVVQPLEERQNNGTD